MAGRLTRNEEAVGSIPISGSMTCCGNFNLSEDELKRRNRLSSSYEQGDLVIFDTLSIGVIGDEIPPMFEIHMVINTSIGNRLFLCSPILIDARKRYEIKLRKYGSDAGIDAVDLGNGVLLMTALIHADWLMPFDHEEIKSLRERWCLFFRKKKDCR